VTDSAPAWDVQARISRLFVYPIKSCAGVELREAVLTETGLDLDRAWMVVDTQGRFMSQRELPRMALIRPTLRSNDVVLRAPGMLALHLQIEVVEEPVTVQVWKDTVKAYDMGDLAAQWFSDFLAPPGPGESSRKPPYRLVRFDPEQQRLSNKRWTGEVDAPNQFSDGFPVLVLSQSAVEGLNQRLQEAGAPAAVIERFRPNVVLEGIEAHDEDNMEALHITTGEGQAVLRLVKPCPRCPIPNVDPATGESHPAVGDAMQAYRALPAMDGAICFGMNAIVIEGVDQVLRTGQAVGANYRFD